MTATDTYLVAPNQCGARTSDPNTAVPVHRWLEFAAGCP